jgi:hypothetical protein
LFSTLVVDSFALREKNDSLFIATGRVEVRFDLRDLWDRRILNAISAMGSAVSSLD